MEKASILSILRREDIVFTFKDILLASGETNVPLLKRRINYYVKNKEIYPIRRGIYAKDKNYDKLELATKIFIPSYVSLEIVLAIFWPINKEIVEKRTGMAFKDYLKKCIAFIESLSDRGILHGMEELLDEKRKAWAKANLKRDATFLMRMRLDQEK
jgi:hypothetical protein